MQDPSPKYRCSTMHPKHQKFAPDPETPRQLLAQVGLGHRPRPQLNAWGPRHIHRRTPLLGHHLKAHGVSPPPPLDSPRIRVCFAVEGDIVPPSHSKTSTFVVAPQESPLHRLRGQEASRDTAHPHCPGQLGHRPRPRLAMSSRIGPSTRASAHPDRSDWVLDTSCTNTERKEEKR